MFPERINGFHFDSENKNLLGEDPPSIPLTLFDISRLDHERYINQIIRSTTAASSSLKAIQQQSNIKSNIHTSPSYHLVRSSPVFPKPSDRNSIIDNQITSVLSPSPQKRKTPETKNSDQPQNKKIRPTTKYPLWTKRALKLSEMSTNKLVYYFFKETRMSLIEKDEFSESGNFKRLYLFDSNKQKNHAVIELFDFKKTKNYEEIFKIVTREIAGYILLINNHFPINFRFNIHRFTPLTSIDSIVSNTNPRYYVKNIRFYSTYLNALEHHLESCFTSGYYLAKYIPDSYAIPDSDEKILQQMGEKDSPLNQLKNMFSKAFEMRISLDLQKKNVRIEKKGTLVFTGLYSIDKSIAEENPFQRMLNRNSEEPNPFEPLIDKLIHSFTKDLTIKESTLLQLKKFLDPRKG